jgi:Mg-chelatase subunit ChlD
MIWFWRSGPRSSARSRRVLRGGAALALILALGGMQIRYGEAPLSVMFVVDESGSMAAARASQRLALNALSAGMRSADRAGLVAFAETAAVERPLTASFQPPPSSAAAIGATTNIEAALSLARAALPGNGRIVLLSDGRPTHGNALAEATRAGAAGIPVDVMVVERPPATAIDVLRVTAPQTVRLSEAFDVVVSASGEPGTRGVITLTSAEGDTRKAAVTLASDGLASVSFSMRADRAGIAVYEAIAQEEGAASEFTSEPRRAGSVVTVAGDLRVLYVGRNPGLAAPLDGLRGFRLDRMDASALPRSAGPLADYDTIVLDNVRADTLDGAQARALSSHVERHGGGLVFLGGRDSLEAGLLTDHPIGLLLPIDLRPRGGERAPSLGLVVAFDKSGSMDDRVDGVPRIEFARLAVRRVFDAVPASDAIGVIAFDRAPQAVAPLARGHDTAALTARLQSVQPSGATAIAPALELASEWLRNATPGVERRHALLVSDGRTSPDDASRLRAILQRGEFELSVVALGADADRRLLESMARLTGGRAYFPTDIRELPAIVARESARVAGGQIVETPFTPISRPHPITAVVDGLPPLGGYVVSAAKPGAESALQSPLGDPILATGRYGLGRVAAYTAELSGAWSSRLRKWDGYGSLLTGMVRWVARSTRDDTLYASFVEADAGLRLTLEAHDGEAPLTGLQGEATVRTPRGDSVRVALQGSAPGRYEARVAAIEPGAYVFAIDARSPDARADKRLVRGVYWSADREYRARTADHALLARLAEVSGGRLLRQGDSVFSGQRTPAYLDLWPWLTVAALLLFLIEVLLPVVPHALLQRRPPSQSYSREAAA